MGTTIKEQLSVMELAELQYLKENKDYLEDFSYSQPEVIRLEKLYEDAV